MPHRLNFVRHYLCSRNIDDLLGLLDYLHRAYKLPAWSWTLVLDELIEQQRPVGNIRSSMVYVGRGLECLIKASEEFATSDERVRKANKEK